MAHTWDNLADERVQLISRYPDPASEGELKEETEKG
jgi:hypothetical protein